MTTNSTKAELRAKLLKLRRNLNPEDVMKRSGRLSVQIISEIDWQNCKNLHVFLPLEGDNEPDIRAFTERALEMGCSIYTTDPACKSGRKVLPLESPKHQSQIKQYQLSDEIDFDYIIVPMIAFDPANNNRLGFGGGFYDRLLAEQNNAKTIGVCFSEFAAENLPIEDHDQKLEAILIA
jgi:5-formyltetrahydrofolate cyclo-ligase